MRFFQYNCWEKRLAAFLVLLILSAFLCLASAGRCEEGTMILAEAEDGVLHGNAVIREDGEVRWVEGFQNAETDKVSVTASGSPGRAEHRDGFSG